MIHGSCLCGAVSYEFEAPTEHFVLCHCRRCKKSSGSAFVAGMIVSGLRFLSGDELIRSYEAPILVMPPNYRRDFCGNCGSPVPAPMGDARLYGVPAGTVDGELGTHPKEHVWVNLEADWEQGIDALPRLTEAQFVLDRVRKHDLAGGENAADGYRFIIDRYADDETESSVVAVAQDRLRELQSPDSG